MRRFTRYLKKSKSAHVNWEKAPDVNARLTSLVQRLKFSWIKTANIYCARSRGTSTRAIARIWGLSRIWQLALAEEPSYIIEVISERYDRLGETEKDKILLHEIAHIPQNFSGSLIPHIRRGKRSFSHKVDVLVAQYLRSRL